MTAPRSIAPYGAWKSPITADLIVASSISFEACGLDGDAAMWIEERPTDEGRNVLVRREPDGRTRDWTPAGFSVRSRANEYGGGAFVADRGVVWFCNKSDQRVWRQDAPDAAPVAITAAEALRFADLEVDRARRRLYAVREDHRAPGVPPTNTLVALEAFGEGGEGEVLASGHDFFAAPRLSPDGTKLAWIAWDQPDMPWDATALYVADVAPDGSVSGARCVAGAATGRGRSESVLQPHWSPGGELFFATDRDGGWWNLHRLRADGVLENVLPMEAEFAKPPWRFGQATYGFVDRTTLLVASTQGGRWSLARLDLAATTRALAPIPLAWSDVRELHVGGAQALLLVGSPTRARSLVLLDLASGAERRIKQASELAIDEGYLSVPAPLEFPTTGGRTAHALFYPPRNRDFEAPAGTKPPLLVLSHGGPTSATSATFSPEIQFFTSRGFGVVDVNYGGSTGYGREYRDRLNGAWGVVDVDDCVAAAKVLVERGEADGRKLCIRGGSAGGYTTLAALTFRPGIFAAGASYYGVSDLTALAADTHKFEARYLDRLVGPYPERRDLYRERSPIEHVEKLSTPVIFFQGLDDRVVPPDQSSRMHAALEKKGIPTALLTFEGEGHGFDRGDTIKTCIESELAFYGKVLGFTPVRA